MSQKSYDNKPSLYLIPTPIGNMEDITLRAINILKQVDIVFSEDTRETAKLLNYLEINKKLISCHKFNEDKVYDKVLEYLSNGISVGLVSDRGTPAISDPGYVAAYHAIKEGYKFAEKIFENTGLREGDVSCGGSVATSIFSLL